MTIVYRSSNPLLWWNMSKQKLECYRIPWTTFFQNFLGEVIRVPWTFFFGIPRTDLRKFCEWYFSRVTFNQSYTNGLINFLRTAFIQILTKGFHIRATQTAYTGFFKWSFPWVSRTNSSKFRLFRSFFSEVHQTVLW